MTSRVLYLAAAAALAVLTGAGSAYAFTEYELGRLHEACRAGDHRACERFGEAIHDHDHEVEWRHHHPDWYR